MARQQQQQHRLKTTKANRKSGSPAPTLKNTNPNKRNDPKNKKIQMNSSNSIKSKGNSNNNKNNEPVHSDLKGYDPSAQASSSTPSLKGMAKFQQRLSQRIKAKKEAVTKSIKSASTSSKLTWQDQLSKFMHKFLFDDVTSSIVPPSPDLPPIYGYGIKPNLVRWIQGITLGMLTTIAGVVGMVSWQQDQQQQRLLDKEASADDDHSGTTTSSAVEVEKDSILSDEWISIWQLNPNNPNNLNGRRVVVYLVGTTHRSAHSIQLTQQLLELVRPKAVFVEWDLTQLSATEAKLPIPIVESLCRKYLTLHSPLLSPSLSQQQGSFSTSSPPLQTTTIQTKAANKNSKNDCMSGPNATQSNNVADTDAKAIATPIPSATNNNSSVTWIYPKQISLLDKLWLSLLPQGGRDSFLRSIKFHQQTLPCYSNADNKLTKSKFYSAHAQIQGNDDLIAADNDDDHNKLEGFVTTNRNIRSTTRTMRMHNEFFQAMQTGQQVGAVLVLGDQRLATTKARMALGSVLLALDWLLGYNRIVKDISSSNYHTNPNGDGNEAEGTLSARQPIHQSVPDLLDTIQNENANASRQLIRHVAQVLRQVVPALDHAFLYERNIYMVHHLHALVMNDQQKFRQQPQQHDSLDTIVAVMGKAHLDGVEELLQSLGWTQVVVTTQTAGTHQNTDHS